MSDKAQALQMAALRVLAFDSMQEGDVFTATPTNRGGAEYILSTATHYMRGTATPDQVNLYPHLEILGAFYAAIQDNPKGKKI